MAITPKVIKNQIELDPNKVYSLSADTIYVDSTTTIKEYIEDFTNQALNEILYDTTTTLSEYLNNVQNQLDNLDGDDIHYDSTTTITQYLNNLNATQITYNGGNLDTFLDTINLTPGNITTDQIHHHSEVLETYLDTLETEDITYDQTRNLQQYLDQITGPGSQLPVDFVAKLNLQSESPYSYKIQYYYNNYINDIYYHIEDVTTTSRRFIICYYDNFMNTNNILQSVYTIHNNQTRIENFEYVNSDPVNINIRSIEIFPYIVLPPTPLVPTTLFTPTGTQPVNRRFHSSEVIYNNIYILGGDDGIIYHKRSDNRMYNPILSLWEKQRSIPIGRCQQSSCAINSLIYNFGGYGAASGDPATYLNDIWCFHPFDNQWEQKSPINPPSPRMGHIAVSYDNKMYIHGGFDGNDYFDDLWVYDPVANTWTQLFPTVKPAARSDHFATMYNNKLYLMGGVYYSGSHTFYTDLWEFDFATTTWTQISNACPSGRGSSTLSVYNDKLYMLGGYSLGSYHNDFIIYDFTTSTWSVLTTPLPPLSDHSSSKINDSLFVFGGYSLSSGYLNIFYCYDFASNTWQNITI